MLLAGASGFLGSHLCDRFLRDGWDVTGLDSLLTGTEGNLAHLASEPGFSLRRHDVTTPIRVDRPVDIVLHFASPASPLMYRRHPIHTLTTNALGTLHTLEVARACGARYVLASTSEVYGDPEVHPQVETYRGRVDPRHPRSAYAEGKRYAEALAMAYHHTHGLDVRIARIFNTYGPRMRIDDGRVVPSFIVNALLDRPLVIHGTGCQTRSFCYVGDVADGIHRLATISGLAGDVVNLGHPEEHTVLELAEIVQRVVGRRLPLTHVPSPDGDPARRCPDISAARTKLGWNPPTSLYDGIQHTATWYREALRLDASLVVEHL
jgi:dTDP-glucose 4,6-dehydratase